MAWEKKHEKSTTRGIRIDNLVAHFLRENFTNKSDYSSNQFIIDLIKNSDEYKKFVAKKKAEDKEPKLNFDYLEN